MRVLVTGANGHIGANLIRELLRLGYDVVPFVRETSDLRGLEGLRLALVYGDVMELDTLRSASEGCDVIIHLAAVYRLWATDPDEIVLPALEGTGNIFTAAEEAGIGRLIYVSSIAAIGSSADPSHLLTADDWHENPRSPYSAAKTRAERSAWQLSEQHNIPMISFCPGIVFGPHDYRITPSMETLQGYANGNGMSSNSGSTFVDVRDVAAILAQAVDEGMIGKRYALTTQSFNFEELGRMVTELTGRKVRHFGAGMGIVKLLASGIELGAKITGKKPMTTRAMADDYGGRYQNIDGEPTYQLFGHTPYPFEQTVRDSLAWLGTIGALKPEVATLFAE